MNGEPHESQAPPRPRSTRRPLPLARFWPVFAWGARIAFRPTRFLLIAVLAVGLGAFVGTMGVAERSPYAEHDKWHHLWQLLDQQALQYLLPLVALLFITPGFAQEVQQRTLVYHLVRPVSRSTVFLARFLSGLLPAILVGSLMLWSMLWTSGLRVPESVVLAVPAVAALDALLLGAVYYMLASMFRWGMIAALVYTFVIESVFSAARGTVQKLSMTYHVRSFFRAQVNDAFVERSDSVRRAIESEGQAEVGGRGRSVAEIVMNAAKEPTYESAGTAVITALVLAALFLAYGVWRTRRRDFPLKD